MTISMAISTISTISIISISISFRLSISLPLVQPGCVLERVSAGVELADSISGSEVVQPINIVVSNASTNTTIAIEGISTPLAIVSMVSMETLGGSGYEGSGMTRVESKASAPVSIEGLGLSLANIVTTTSIASGLDSVSIGCRPCGC